MIAIITLHIITGIIGFQILIFGIHILTIHIIMDMIHTIIVVITIIIIIITGIIGMIGMVGIVVHQAHIQTKKEVEEQMKETED
jgi:hypothetical protein